VILDRPHLRGIWRQVRRAAPQIVALMLCGVLVGVLVWSLTPTRFDAQAVLEVEAQASADPQLLARQMQAIELRLMGAETLIGIIERHRLFDGEALGEAEKLAALRDAVRFDPIFDRFSQTLGAARQLVALSIRAQSETPEKAARIANDLAQSALDLAARSQSGVLRLLPLERARSTYAADPLGPWWLAFLGACAGAFAGFVQIILAYRRDPVLRNAAQIERQLGVLVLASVPDLSERRHPFDLARIAQRPLKELRGGRWRP
jgi:hypothetical protein